MQAVETRVRVRYAETDQMGVVYYANYLVWMEVGRIELCRARGFNYRDLEQQDGIFLAVAESGCRHVSPARYDEEVAIRTWVEDPGARMVTFRYEMTVGERKVAKGFTKHVFLNRELRPARLPEKYLALFR